MMLLIKWGVHIVCLFLIKFIILRVVLFIKCARVLQRYIVRLAGGFIDRKLRWVGDALFLFVSVHAYIFSIILIFFRLVDQLLIFVVKVVREIIVVESVAAFKLYYLKSFLFMFFFLGDWKNLDHFLWLLVLAGTYNIVFFYVLYYIIFWFFHVVLGNDWVFFAQIYKVRWNVRRAVRNILNTLRGILDLFIQILSVFFLFLN